MKIQSGLIAALACLLQCGLCLAQSAPDATLNGIDQVQHWGQQRTQQAGQAFQQANLKRMPSPGFWGSEIVYQIQVDRFNNGDLSNDKQNIENHQRERQAGQDWYGILDYRHGGDIKGIEDRLDYLSDLGVTTLWITPIFKHNGAYHGYCTTDFSQIDPGFGSNESFRAFVAKAHAKGMRVVLDIVVNHMCDDQTYYEQPARHYDCAEAMEQSNWSGSSEANQHQGELKFSDRFFGPLKNKYFFNRCGPNSNEDMQGTGPVAVYGDFVSVMFDFNTRNRDFQKIFTELHKYWIAYADVDGFRMDAAKHITEDFVAYFNTHIRDYAKSLGKSNFFLVGEVAGPSDWIGRRLGNMYSNPSNPDDHGQVPRALTEMLHNLQPIYSSNPTAPFPGLNAAYDFAHGGTSVDVLHNRRQLVDIENHFSSGYYRDISGQGDYRMSWNLLEIHDWPRFASFAPNNPYKSMLGLSYLALAEGSPVIYYGMEQGFNGDCHFDKLNAGNANDSVKQECKGHSHSLYRQDMFVGGMARLGSTVGEINKLAYIGKIAPEASPHWSKDPFLNRDHQVYKLARKAFALRNSCQALKYGKTHFRWSTRGTQGILAFSRIDKDQEALVIVNNASFDVAIPSMRVQDQSNGTAWVNLFNTQERAWTTGNGNLTFSGRTIAGNSTMVFVPEYNLGAYDDVREVHKCQK